MYAVIFKATTTKLDNEYRQTAKRMRQLATEKYGCKDFTSVTEGDKEISISYWGSQEQIKAWKSDPEHVLAQQKGRSKWYRSYHVQVAEVIREYGEKTDPATKM